MKRILLSMLMAVVAIGASAQFKSTVTAGVKDYNYHVSYNFEDVCQSLGVTPESFGHALEVWLDPYRFQNWPDEYSRHEAKNYMFGALRERQMFAPLQKVQYRNAIISTENKEELVRTADFDGYEKFNREHYLK